MLSVKTYFVQLFCRSCKQFRLGIPNLQRNLHTATAWQPTADVNCSVTAVWFKNLPFYSCRRISKFYSNNVDSGTDHGELTPLVFDQVSSHTLEVLADFFDELGESGQVDSEYDVTYSDGVLTVNLGQAHGTYVINKQTPNKQIWLSSPSSGPKRYDYIGGGWIYKHSGVSLHTLLTEELSKIFDRNINCEDR